MAVPPTVRIRKKQCANSSVSAFKSEEENTIVHLLVVELLDVTEVGDMP